MAYKRLSEQVQELANPQRSDTFVDLFRAAVRQGTIKAAFLPGERFDLPKQFTRRGNGETYTKSSREMIFEHTPEFDTWFEERNKELAVARQGGSIKPTVENIEAGLVDFDALVEQTRSKMQSRYQKGQQLGQSRKGKQPTAERVTKKS